MSRQRRKLRAPTLALLDIGEAAAPYHAVLNGRFKGGHITRQYGRPADGVHAVQLEMTQCGYMQEAMPFNYLPERAVGVQASSAPDDRSDIGICPGAWDGVRKPTKLESGL